jgi:hypothetical protein
MLLSQKNQRALEIDSGLIDQPYLCPGVHPKIERYLIVPAPPGVQLARNILYPVSKELLDIHVYVFTADVELDGSSLDIIRDALKPCYDGSRITNRDDPALAQHPGVRDAPANVILPQARVETYGRIELVHKFGRLLIKPTTP